MHKLFSDLRKPFFSGKAIFFLSFRKTQSHSSGDPQVPHIWNKTTVQWNRIFKLPYCSYLKFYNVYIVRKNTMQDKDIWGYKRVLHIFRVGKGYLSSFSVSFYCHIIFFFSVTSLFSSTFGSTVVYADVLSSEISLLGEWVTVTHGNLFAFTLSRFSSQLLKR